MVVASDLATFPVSFARAYGGDFIGPNLKLVPDPAAMEKAFATLADLYKAGALPRTFATTSNDDQVTWLQQGRAAFTVLPFARYAQLNRQDQSKYPGRIKAVEFPISAALKGKVPMASCVEFWAMCIPNNARDKDLAWSFIQTMSGKAITLGAARNGNGPARTSTYQRSQLRCRATHGRGGGEGTGEARAFRCPRFPTRRARRRCSWRRCSSRCSAARPPRKRSPRSSSGSRR